MVGVRVRMGRYIQKVFGGAGGNVVAGEFGPGLSIQVTKSRRLIPFLTANSEFPTTVKRPQWHFR